MNKKIIIGITIALLLGSIGCYVFLKNNQSNFKDYPSNKMEEQDPVNIPNNNKNDITDTNISNEEEKEIIKTEEQKNEVTKVEEQEINNQNTQIDNNQEITNKEETNPTNDNPKPNNNSSNSNQSHIENIIDDPVETPTAEEKEEEKYIGVPDPTHGNYQIHHGHIDYKVSDYPNEDIHLVCFNKGIEIGFLDSVDIENTVCIDVFDGNGTLLGEYLQINCNSGNCNKYKTY